MIFVTGATGLVGSHLTYHLISQGHKVKLLVRKKHRISRLARTFQYYGADLNNYDNQIQLVEGDITDIFSLETALETDVDSVIHCAGLVSFSPLDKGNLLNINHHGTENMVNAALEAGVKKFIYVSSIAALGDGSDNKVKEDNQEFEFNPVSVYGNSKHLAELEVWRGVEEGMDAVIVNPTVIIGPGQWDQGSPRLFKSVWKGLPFFTTGTTGFVDVRDVAKAMSDLLFNDISNQQFILNNENLNYRQFFNMVADNLSVRRPRFAAQPWMMYFLAAITGFFSKLTGHRSQINKNTASSAFSKTFYDNSKIEQTLKTNFEGIEKAINFTAGCFLKDHR
ncbi:MAG TPA: NAD-dependent epimerase/dehydratase family protein [Salinivirga sp.]|uniref:NAD-dependent epimerase/dehydratase family protein n=1 Tax=Salinivirga sp. TaxID=1970192 RepID=UPI002B499995|nr:NAD-dependent epimerase/dehydratase family protein [Salinivirga sp.]HKK58084.1 NAD-dependent epimerase/dehydratase family protein [Salinivirga sp.]